MFKVQDFLNIFEFLKWLSLDKESNPIDPVPQLDTILKIHAQAEGSKARQLFENTIDQLCFGSDDYKRIKNFMIDWYTAHRTLTSVQQRIADVHGMPNDHLDELFRSFGYNYSQELDAFTNKASFFLDLVNLYKIKGTPHSVVQVLNYYGLIKIDLFEFSLQKNTIGELVFRPQQITPQEPGELTLPSIDIPFESMISFDPHWMQSSSDIERLVDENVIALPSKSPYFSLRPRYKLGDLKLPIAIIQSFIQSSYEKWAVHNEVPEKSLIITQLNYSVSTLELYLATIYTFNLVMNRHTVTSDTRFLCYCGDNEIIAYIISEYNTLRMREDPNDPTYPYNRNNRAERLEKFYSIFTKPITENVLEGIDLAEVLSELCPSLKLSIDTRIGVGEGYNILKLLLNNLSTWIRGYVGPEYPDLATTVLGLDAIDYLSDVMNFFKPYRARLAAFEILFIIEDPLEDTILFDDKVDQTIAETIVDFHTCDSSPCCDGASCSLYSRETYDCGSYFDAGHACDQTFDTEVTSYIESRMICPTDSSAVVYTGEYPPSPYHELATDSTSVFWQDGNWNEFDDGSCFDNHGGRDVCSLYVMDIINLAEISWNANLTFEIEQGDSIPYQLFQVWNSGHPLSVLVYTLTPNATWISTAPQTGEVIFGPVDDIIIDLNTSSLPPGMYENYIAITAPNTTNSPQHVPVYLTVLGFPGIALSTYVLNPICNQGENAPDQIFDVWNSGYRTLNYVITTDSPSWISVSPTSGSSTGEHDAITVSYNTSGFSVGETPTGTIIISDPNATNDPQIINVQLEVI